MSNNALLDRFLAISSWQAALAIILFVGIQIGLWFTFKRFKLKFIYRVLIGLVIGLGFWNSYSRNKQISWIWLSW